LPALKYGFYAKTFGRKFSHYVASGIYTGEFRGAAIEVHPFYAKMGRWVQATTQIRNRVRAKLKGEISRLRRQFKPTS
jgi:hypothetical protein